MKILFIAPYPKYSAASQRFRFEQYFSEMEKMGIHFELSSFFDLKTWNIIYKPGYLLQKIWGLCTGYFRRLKDLLRLHKFDYIFIHREDSPLGLPVFAWMAAKIFKKKIIYDFDDAIWIPNASESNDFVAFLKRYSNTRTLCKLAYKVSCGNKYLCEYATQFNQNVYLIPTVIDTENYHNVQKKFDNSKLVIGWTGSHSTIKFLDEIFEVFRKLENQGYSFEFRVISDLAPAFKLNSMTFVPWDKNTEIAELLKFDVGIMPLADNRWSKGKCGFKALQYMSLGIPAMVSPVGVNSEIVDDGLNGIICHNVQDWEHHFIRILNDKSILFELAKSTRDKIINNYSVKAQEKTFFQLFS